jgi:protein gp37
VSDNSTIEWTDATWNPVTGCTEVSPGCDRCYAKTFAERWRGTPGHYFEQGFDVVLRPDKLALPLRWKRPRKVFVNSMSDLFHDAVPDEYIAQVFAVMAATPQHTYQVLTKRHGRMRSLLRNGTFVEEMLDTLLDLPGGSQAMDEQRVPWPLPNIWLGVSTENQAWANVRIPALLDTPAAVRWISAEPLLGPIDLDRPRPHDCATHRGSVCPPWYSNELDWVVAGGESGVGARPVNPQWIRDLRDQCTAGGVPFLFKQWGGRTSKVGGRELDGRTWDEYPVLTRGAA